MDAVPRAALLASPLKFTGTLSNTPPVVPTTSTQLGYNMQSSFTPAGLAAAKAGGATLVRFQPSWDSVESYSSPGTYSLDATTEAALAYCGANGLQPIAVGAYGPPYRAAMTVTVTAPVSPGARTLPVSGQLGTITTPLDHVKFPNSHITAEGKWGYYGALIDTVDTSAGTITLASATTVSLSAGDQLTVNRLLYPSPADQSLTNPSLIAYFAYLSFIAQRMAANGCTGYVTIWNEAPWAHDPWDARGKFYDTPPGGMNIDPRMKMFLQKALTLSGLPAGVRLINGATDKSGNNGLIVQGLAPTSGQIAATVAVESIHPYHDLPEGAMWDPGLTTGSNFRPFNPTLDNLSSFRGLAYSEANAGTGLKMMGTELGTNQTDDTKQAVYLLRRVVASWASAVTPIVFALSDGSDVGYNVVAPGTYSPRLAYTALARLMAAVAALGGSGGTAADIPTLVTYGGQQWPLLSLGVPGAAKSLLLLWQRTGYDSPTKWSTVANPAPAKALYQMPTGKNLLSAVDLLTGNPVAASVTSGTLAVPVTHTVTALTFG